MLPIASNFGNPAHLSGTCKIPCVLSPTPTQKWKAAPCKRRRLNQIRSSTNGNRPDPPPIDDLGDLGDRILSGEFTDEGSTKERLSRPVRKLLAKDPIGPGWR